MISKAFNTNYVVHYMETQFNILIVGMMVWGKTIYLLDMTEKDYKN